MDSPVRFLVFSWIQYLRTRRSIIRSLNRALGELSTEFERSRSEAITLASRVVEQNGTIAKLQGELTNTQGVLARLLANEGPGARLLASDVITLTGKVEQLTKESLRDPLTGLFNRRAVEAIVHPEIHLLQRSAATDVSVSVVAFDLDHFKRVNDTCGHAAGDTVLRRIAELARSVFRRDVDHLFRFGGEEFIIISLHTSPSMAGKLAETLRLRIASDAMLRLESVGQVTASFGISTLNLNEQVAAEASINAACARADQALYAAKAGGRNVVMVE